MRNGPDVSCGRARVLLTAAASLLILAGCASMVGLDSDPAKQAGVPDYRVGDRWVYHVEDGFRLPIVWDETWEVTTAGAEGVTVRITRKGEHIDDVRTEIWPQPGLVSQGALMSAETRHFNTPYQRYRFPMRAGDSWSQRLDTVEAKERQGQQPSLVTRALGWEKIKTGIGEVDALELNQIVTFDDEDPWRWATNGNYEIWYAPAVNNVVYARKRASYLQKGDRFGIAQVPSQFEIVELRSYTRGQP